MRIYTITVNDQEISLYSLGQALTPDVMGSLLSEWLNTYENTFNMGEAVGRELHNIHHTMQGSVARFLLGVFAGLAEYPFEWADACNSDAIKVARHIRSDVEEGIIPKPRFI